MKTLFHKFLGVKYRTNLKKENYIALMRDVKEYLNKKHIFGWTLHMEMGI